MFAAASVGQGPGSVTPVARWLAALLALWCCDALALPDEAIVVAAADLPRAQLEVSSTPIPPFDAADPAARASRIDFTLMPQERSGLGLAMGIRSRARPAMGLSPHPPMSSTLDVGLNWRYTFPSNSHRVDFTAYRRAPNPDALDITESREPGYGARVEMGFTSAKNLRKGFVADRGFVGLQLESGGRLTIRRKFGGPMLYYRNTFY